MPLLKGSIQIAAQASGKQQVAVLSSTKTVLRLDAVTLAVSCQVTDSPAGSAASN